MNGDKLLEAMSFVDEKYIAEADADPVRKKHYWAPLAAMAACFCLIVYSWNTWLSPSEKVSPVSFATVKATVEEEAAEELAEDTCTIALERTMLAASAGANSDVMTASLIDQVTVRVTEVREDCFTAEVTAEGIYAVGTELTIALPEQTTPAIELDAALVITFTPGDAEIIQPISVDLAE